MSKIVLFLIFITSLYSAPVSMWSQQESFKLKKDEIANISIATTASKGEDKTSFFFRWTLVVGDRVTVLSNNNGYPKQHILYNKRSLDSVTFNIMPDGSNRLQDRNYLLLVLSEISPNKDEVSFNVFIKDDKKRILVDFGLPKKK